jgi:hypothetical protein
MKNLKLLFFILANIWLTCSCSMFDKPKPLKGKIIVERVFDSIIRVYDNSDKPMDTFKTRDDSKLAYGMFNWLNTKDSLIGYEDINREVDWFHVCNIALFDLRGRLIEYIYKAERGETALPLYPSRNDKYLLFTTQKTNVATSQVSLVIMDLEKRMIVGKIDSFGWNPFFFIHESPWLHGGYRFVYTYGDIEGDPNNPNTVPRGVYIYDILSRERKMLIPGGDFAVVSPTTNEIAYEKDHSIKVLDLNRNKVKTIYNFWPKETLRNMHWTPDGKDIYFAYQNYGYNYLLDYTGEKLIEVSTGKSKSFKNIGLGFNIYSWK